MGRERWFRGGREGQERPFDWYTLAKEREIPLEHARALYEEATRRARESQGPHRNAQALFLELLDEAHQEAWRPSPGKVTRTMRLAAERAGKRPRARPAAPGKRTLTSYLDQPGRARGNTKNTSQERERLEAIAGSFRAMGAAVPADLQRALARLQHADPAGKTPAFLPADVAATAAPAMQARSGPGTAADRRLQANLAAAHGHFEELDALEDELLAAEPATTMEASLSLEADREDIGEPLPAETRTRMERVFGVGFSDVVVYPASPEATGATRALTRGREIHFRADAYAPGTSSSDWLIAHELAHVVQQTAARGPRTGRRALEAEADRAAGAALAGQRAAVSHGAPMGAAQAFSDAEEHDHELPESQDAGAMSEAPVTVESPAGVAAAPASMAVEEPEPIELGALAQELATSGAGVDAAPTPAPGGGSMAAPGGADAGLEAQAPAVSQAPPEQGLAALAGVRPDRLAGALGHVRTAVGHDVAEDRETLAQVPRRQMSTGEDVAGAAATRDAVQGEPGAADAAAPQATEAAAAGQGEPAAVAPAAGDALEPADAGAAPPPMDAAVTPTAADAPEGQGMAQEADGMADVDMARMSDSLEALPTSAPTASTEPGPAPALDVAGAAAASTEARRAALDESVTRAEDAAAIYIARPMGEDSVASARAPAAFMDAGDGAAASTAANAGAAMTTAAATVQATGAAAPGATEAAGMIAHIEKRAEIDAALEEAQAQMATERQAHVDAETQARARVDGDIAALRTQADAEQMAARAEARAQVEQTRADWQAEVHAQAAAARAEAAAEVQVGMADVEVAQAQANTEARRHLDQGRARAEAEQAQGEQEAARIKEEKEEESGGFIGWAESAATDFFAGVEQAISDTLTAVREGIRRVLDAARELAVAAIEAAQQVIVDTIRAVGDALTAIGDRLRAAFPALRERFGELMQGLIDSAIAAVDQIAAGLQRGVQAARGLMARGLEAALHLLEAGLHAVVNGVSAVVQGALRFAAGVVQSLGTFAVLIKDVAGNPGGWLRLLGAAIVDGIQNHLWVALQTAVLGWFGDKVLELLGIGGVVLELLTEGGIDLGQITSMAWEALQSAIPAALIAILVEKLMSMLVPAAGAVMAILEGLQAAWGAVSRIIAAMSAFVAFLHAVAGGAAGPLFANLLALSTVVIIDFVSSWLLRKLARAARRVGSRLRQMAARFRKRRGDRRRGERRDQDTDRRRDRDDDVDDETLAQKQARLRRAVADVRELFRGKRRVRPMLRSSLARIKRRHRLRQLRARRTGSGQTSTYEITAIINPKVVFEATAVSDDAKKLAAKLKAYSQKQNNGSQEAVEEECQNILKEEFKGAGYRVTWRHLSAAEWSATMHDKSGQSFSVGVLQKLTNAGVPVAKTGPTTDPNTPHNKKIASLIKEHREQGWQLIGGGRASDVTGSKPERILHTEGGHKDTRRMDITLRNPQTGETLHINVGLGMQQRRRKKDGPGYHEIEAPIKREREAQRDVEGMLEPNERFEFVAYNF